MKQIHLIALLLSVGFLVASCDQFYFSTPLPVDSKNIYEFPNNVRGSWAEAGDSIVVGRTNFTNVEYSERQIARSEVKSSKRYKLKGDKIYITDKDKGLDGKIGFPYVLKNDTIYYREAEVFKLTLNESTFLRKAGHLYVLNSKQGANWYEIFLIDVRHPDMAIIQSLKVEDLDEIYDIETLHVAQNQNFLEACWTQKDITEFRQKGVFSDTLLVLKRKKN